MRLHAVRFSRPLDPADLAALARHVEPERRARLGRYRRWQDAHRALYAGLLARIAVAERLGTDPPAFAATPQGKPFVPGAPDLHFNLSHSGDWVLCAAGPAPLGVDVERVQPLTTELLDEVLTPAEREAFEACPAEARPARFFTLWTLKEAYAKALGFGLQLRFRDLEADLGPGGVRLRMHGRPVEAAFHAWSPDPEHPAALCVLGPAGPRPEPRLWTPEALMARFGHTAPDPVPVPAGMGPSVP